MFLRPYKRFKDGKEHTYYALVESVRTANGPRQHIVAYLGELNHDQERRWQRTVVCYNRQGDAQQLRLFRQSNTPQLTFFGDSRSRPRNQHDLPGQRALLVERVVLLQLVGNGRLR